MILILASLLSVAVFGFGIWLGWVLKDIQQRLKAVEERQAIEKTT